MIQRIQTVYLLLAIGCLGWWFFAPIGAFNWPDGHRIFTSIKMWGDGGFADRPQTGLWAAGLVCLALSALFFSLANFKNRPKQLRAGRLALALIAGTVLIQYFMLNLYEPVFSNTTITVSRSTGMGFYLTPAALVFVFLAQRAIRADEELVKSLDRLR